MSTFKSIVKSTATVFAGLTLASAASAATFNFDLQAPTSSVNKSGSYADQYNYTVDGVDMRVNGYTRRSGTTTEQKVGIFRGYGMGVEQASGNEHTLDNNNGLDYLTFSFDQDMILDSATVGWYSQDSDISIYAHNGTGFTKIDDGINMRSDVARDFNGDDFASSIWAIAAYDGSDKSISYGNDFVKMSFVSFSSAPVAAPAPATLGLMSIVLAGLGLRKRARKAA